MFGSGETRLQPAYVEDVAEAIVRVLRAPAVRQLYELAGPRVYTYQELLRTISASAGTRPFFLCAGGEGRRIEPGPVSVQLMACYWVRLRNSADSADHQKSSRIDGERQHPRARRSRF